MRLAPLLAALLTLFGSVAAAPLLAPAAPTAADVALAKAEALLDSGDFASKTPRGWRSWAEARFAPPTAQAAPGDLEEAVLAVYGALGVAPTEAQRAGLAGAVVALDPRVAGALGALAAVVAEAYVEQTHLLPLVDLDPAPGEPMMPLAGTARGVANAERVLAAIEAFRAGADALPPTAGFRDPLGLVVLGSSGPDTFVADGQFGDPVLLADLGGDDLDLTSSGGACPFPLNGAATCNGLALAVRVDVAGDDTYRFSGPHGVAQGSGAFGGLGILVDGAGNDLYDATQLVSHGPFITYYINGVMQGGGEAGFGLLLDAGGDDVYRFTGLSNTQELFGQGQGFAGLGGFGALLDASGTDFYDARVTCNGSRGQFCGLYVQSTALYPGVSIQVDGGDGDDRYWGILTAPQQDYYSQSFAAFGAFALLVDQGGDDDYLSSATSSDPTGGVSLNCAFGTAEYAGALAIFIDADGNDRYVTETISSNPPVTMAEGFSLASASLFWDVRGDDHHEMRAIGPNPTIIGRALGSSLIENSAVYLDTGGVDVYVDPIGADGSVWGPQQGSAGLGVDLNIIP